MPYRMDPRIGYDRSNYQLGRTQMQGPLRDFLRDLATRDRVAFYDDFLGDTIDLNSYAVAKVGTGVAFAIGVATGGTIVATPETGVTNSSVSLVTPLIWGGNNNATFETRFKVNTVASTFIMEAGFIDAVPGSSAPGVTDIDTPTFAGTNSALFSFDNSQTHTAVAFGTVGNFTSQTVASTLITAATAGFTTPAANTYITVKIQLLTDPDETGKTKAYCWVNGILRARHEAAAGAVNGQVPLAGWVFCSTIAAAAKTFTVDYLRISADRFPLGVASE